MRFIMNRKLIFGLASVGFAGLFWACGSGEIMEIVRDDSYVQYTLDEDSTFLDGLVQKAVAAYCADEAGPNYEQCVKDVQPGHINENGGASSSSAGPTSPYATSSSGTGPGNQQQNPNSSGNINIVSSPSQTQNPTSSPVLTPTSHSTVASSSSAPAADPNAWGTCGPNVANGAIEKGKSVQWKVSLDQDKVPGGISILTKGNYSWTFDGGGDPATKSGQGTSFQSVLVSYATSGVKNATVTVSNNGQSNTIKCSELNVTGAAITGCVCAPSVTQVDIATPTPVTWTVSGCKSTDGTYSYIWSDNLSGGASAGGTLNSKGTFAPTVTVKNSDNGMQVVTCGAVTAIDSNHPDYIVKVAGQQGEIDLPAGKVTVFLEVDAYNGKVICNANGPITGTVNTTTQLNGSYYVSVPMSGLKKGAQLVFELSSPAKCGVE